MEPYSRGTAFRVKKARKGLLPKKQTNCGHEVLPVLYLIIFQFAVLATLLKTGPLCRYYMVPVIKIKKILILSLLFSRSCSFFLKKKKTRKTRKVLKNF